MKDELDDARALAQVDEDQSAVVTAAVHPAGDADLIARARCVELSRPRIPIAVGPRRVGHGKAHRRLPRRIGGVTAWGSISVCSPDSMFLKLTRSGSSPMIAT